MVLAKKGFKSSEFQKHIARIPDYLWLAEDGLKMQGYNGSQCWDTSFCIQAVIEAKSCDNFPNMTKKVWEYLERTQILSTPRSQASIAYKYESPEMRKKYYRHVSEGGWPFSTSAYGWPISDCTAEGLKGVLALKQLNCIKNDSALNKINDQRLFNAVNVILTLQNHDGGWATYENNRGYGWYELLNPSEIFGDIMIDYSYVECSSASMQALYEFQKYYPNHRRKEIQKSIQRGAKFLLSIQRKDGSWYGSWGCCFTYACWFGIEGLLVAGYPKNHKNIIKAINFLLKHQNPNGGWGEDFSSCYDRSYSPNGAGIYGDDKSGIIQTSWALLALMAADYHDKNIIDKGIKFLMKKQQKNGDWDQEGIAGVFNRACGITYTAYRNVFPIWALGRYSKKI